MAESGEKSVPDPSGVLGWQVWEWLSPRTTSEEFNVNDFEAQTGINLSRLRKGKTEFLSITRCDRMQQYFGYDERPLYDEFVVVPRHPTGATHMAYECLMAHIPEQFEKVAIPTIRQDVRFIADLYWNLREMMDAGLIEAARAFSENIRLTALETANRRLASIHAALTPIPDPAPAPAPALEAVA